VAETIDQVRLRFNWFNPRPVDVELWVSDDPSVTPDSGAALVGTFPLAPKGHRCVTGDPCDVDVPDACCPDGRDAPQDTRDVGQAHWKYDIIEPPSTTARMLYVRMPVSHDADFIQLAEVGVYERLCGGP
jgi:hypothetical protein